MILIKESIVEDFLQYLENIRGNSINTRNQRLAAIQAFYRYLQTRFALSELGSQRSNTRSIVAKALLISCKSSFNNVTSTELIFSSNRAIFLVPGIGTIHSF